MQQSICLRTPKVHENNEMAIGRATSLPQFLSSFISLNFFRPHEVYECKTDLSINSPSVKEVLHRIE